MSSQPKKRKYHDGKRRNNPRRGGPGILMTCETGRETKCEREGIDILNHYSSSASCSPLTEQQQQQPKDDDSSENKTTKTTETTTTSTKLSLEEELKMLRQQQKSPKKRGGGMFQVYETGCRGSVFVMCTSPGCNLIPLISRQQDTKRPRVVKDKDDDDDEKSAGNDNSNKEQKDSSYSNPIVEDVTTNTTKDQWEPVTIVRKILADQKSESSTAPSSR